MMILFFSLFFQAQAAPTAFISDLNNFKSKNLKLQTEQQNLDSASDLLLSKKLFWTPTLSISANQSQTKLNSQNISDYNYLQADISLNIFRGGSDLNSLFSASAAKKAQQLQLQNETSRVEIKASDLVFQALYLAESLRIQEQLYKLKEESFKIVKDRYSQGKIPSQEMVKSEVDLTQQKNRLRIAQLDVLENKTNILSAFITEIQTKEWPFDEKTILEVTRGENLPIIEQKYWIAESREQAWRAARGLHWPSLDLQIQYQESEIKNREKKQLIGLLSLTLPLWNRYDSSSQISASYTQYITAFNDYRDTEQTLRLKNSFLKEKILVSKQNLVEAKKNVQSARKLYQDILRSFRIGRLSTNDLFIEQNRLLESETILAQNQLTFHQSLIEACALSGANAMECIH